MDYKKYPYLPHQDPNSPEYIHSELSEYHDEVAVTSYNTVIDNFKNDLKVQREVWQAISNLDRPYKHGIRGIDTNIYEDGPVKPKLQDLGFERQDINDEEFGFSNEDRFIANTPFHKKHNFQHIKQWEQERLNRPVTKHFNPKGYKYDVEMKPEEKYQFVADRLGHPEFLGTPVDRLFKLENDIFHPTYLDQPFVQTPNAKPSANLNFEQGEVLYENTRVLEWVRFIQLFGLTGGAYIALYVPFSLGYKTNLVTDAADELITNQYHLVSPTTVDILRLSIPIGVGAIAYTVYGLLNYTNSVTSQYVVKMSYSKDKELLFVKRIDLHGVTYEEVYETAHLEIVPPAQRSGVADLSSYDEDGIWRITDLNTGKFLLAYNDKNHWNLHLRDEFFQKTLNMWDKSYYGYNRVEQEDINRRWREQAESGFGQEKLPGF